MYRGLMPILHRCRSNTKIAFSFDLVSVNSPLFNHPSALINMSVSPAIWAFFSPLISLLHFLSD